MINTGKINCESDMIVSAVTLLPTRTAAATCANFLNLPGRRLANEHVRQRDTEHGRKHRGYGITDEQTSMPAAVPTAMV